MDTQVKEFLVNDRVSSLSVVLPNSSVHASALHYSYQNDPLTLFLSFTPLWWRYTDYNIKTPTIITNK